MSSPITGSSGSWIMPSTIGYGGFDEVENENDNDDAWGDEPFPESEPLPEPLPLPEPESLSQGLDIVNRVKDAIEKYASGQITFHMLYEQIYKERLLKAKILKVLEVEFSPREELINRLLPFKKNLPDDDSTLVEIQPLVDKILNGDVDLFAFAVCTMNESPKFSFIMKVLFEYHKEAPSLLEIDAKWPDPKTGKEISAINKILELLKKGLPSIFGEVHIPKTVLELLQAGSRPSFQDKFIWLTPDHLARSGEDYTATYILHHTLDHLLAAQAALEIDCTVENLRATLKREVIVPHLTTRILRGLKPSELIAIPDIYLEIAKENYDKEYLYKSSRQLLLLLPFIKDQAVVKISASMLKMLKEKAPSKVFFHAILIDYIRSTGDWVLGREVVALYEPLEEKKEWKFAKEVAALYEPLEEKQKRESFKEFKRVVGLQSILEDRVKLKEILPIIHSYDSVDIPVE